jgi:hypothetical protein
MTPDEAYRKGQEDMRRRIMKMWNGWRTDGIGGIHRANRLGRKGYADVPVHIRARCKVQPLDKSPEKSDVRNTQSQITP